MVPYLSIKIRLFRPHSDSKLRYHVGAVFYSIKRPQFLGKNTEIFLSLNQCFYHAIVESPKSIREPKVTFCLSCSHARIAWTTSLVFWIRRPSKRGHTNWKFAKNNRSCNKYSNLVNESLPMPGRQPRKRVSPRLNQSALWANSWIEQMNWDIWVMFNIIWFREYCGWFSCLEYEQ